MVLKLRRRVACVVGLSAALLCAAPAASFADAAPGPEKEPAAVEAVAAPGPASDPDPSACPGPVVDPGPVTEPGTGSDPDPDPDPVVDPDPAADPDPDQAADPDPEQGAGSGPADGFAPSAPAGAEAAGPVLSPSDAGDGAEPATGPEGDGEEAESDLEGDGEEADPDPKDAEPVYVVEKVGDFWYLTKDGEPVANVWYTWDDGTRSFFSNKFHEGAAVADTWWTVGGLRRLFGLDARLVTSTTYEHDGYTYLLDEDGVARTNVWYTWDDGDRSFFSGNFQKGAAVEDRWWTVGGKKRLFGDDARLVTSTAYEHDGYTYLLDEDGAARTNLWYDLDGGRAFFSANFHDGAAVADAWWTVGGVRRLFGAAATLVTDRLQEFAGYLYWLDGEGAARTNVWYDWEDGDRSFFSANFQKGAAVVARSWTVGGEKRMFDEDARMLVGVDEVNGYLYWSDADGVMVANRWYDWEDGKRSFFSKNFHGGAAVEGRWTVSGKYYYFKPSTRKHVVGWVTWEDGKRSYFSANLGGAAVTNGSWTISGKKYYFDSVGAMRTGWVIWNSGAVSYFGKDGSMYTGTHIVDGISVNFTSSGRASLTSKIRMVVKAQKLTSDTNRLIMIDTGSHRVGVFIEDDDGSWNLSKYWACSTGMPGHEIYGTFSTSDHGEHFGESSGYTAWWWTRIHKGVLFHSTLYYPYSKTSHMDSRLGLDISHGCIRLDINNAKWIYDNIKPGTTVQIYRA